jgi:hypothetical protein
MGITPLFQSTLEDQLDENNPDLESASEVGSRLNKHGLLLSSSPSEVSLYLLDETFVLYRFATSRGLELAPELSEELFNIAQDVDLDANALAQGVMTSLSRIHKALCTAIYPATPKSARYLYEQERKESKFKHFGNVPLIRHFSLLTISLLMGLCLVGMQPQVNAKSMELGILHSNGLELLLNLVFVLICAGLGSCFATLFRVNTYIAKGSFDPAFSTTYWSRLVLGMMSGIIIVELLPSSLFADDSLGSFCKPTFAMLAGFSADLVYRLLEKLVTSIKTVVQGDEQSRNDFQDAKNRAEVTQRTQEAKMAAAEKMMGVSQLINTGNIEAADREIKSFISNLRSHQ